VAIALIGDPEVVLLDEPSAGLDPVSRRNLWSVILRTMSHRAVILTTHSMDEAEALCGRMGVMVKGQVRILGSKQRLKSKFGSGFELNVKLHANDALAEQVEALVDYVKTLFPSTTVLAENGGQVTLEVPKEEMNIGKVFTELEVHKKRLGIEDYMVAQPTLEQVFIRTVHRYDPAVKSMTGASLALVSVDGEAAHNPADQVVADVNKCGCTDFFVKIFSAVNCGLFILFWVIAIAVIGRSDPIGNTILFLLGIAALIAVIVGMILLCCACCKPPRGANE
jgi:energy-coupling factor transporter ATP-binding protein EcfA2